MAARRTYRFMLTPKWIAFTLVTVAAIALCLVAANWQLNRLHERRDRNAEITAKQALTPVPLDEVIAMDAPLEDGKDAQWTIATVTGTYDPANEVLIRNRAYDGAGGVHVITPLRLADGSGAVLVNRGWLPNPPDPVDPVIPPDPLAGQVTVQGRVRATQVRGRFGDSDPSEGVLRDLARVDIERLRQQIPYPIGPVYVELIAQDPADPVGPTPVRPPELGDGPHLSYTGQWLLFAIIAMVGWVLVVRRHASTERKQAARDAAVQTAISSRTARDIPLRNVRPVRRTEGPPREDSGGDAGPPAAPLPDGAADSAAVAPSIDPLLKPVATPSPAPTAADPASSGTQAADQRARVARRQPPPEAPGDAGEQPPHH